MNSEPKFACVIAAGGSGARFGTDIPKQFAYLGGYPVIAHTVRKFCENKLISEIVIVSHGDYVVYCSDIVRELGLKKVVSVVRGGKTRGQSVRIGLEQLSDDVTHVLIHDAARPGVSNSLITDCCIAASEYGACTAAVRAVDTLKISEDGEFASKTVDRNKFWQIQTPQGFEKNAVLRWHNMAKADGFDATDDCALAEKYGARVKLVEGSRTNIKITEKNDLDIMEAIIGCE